MFSLFNHIFSVLVDYVLIRLYVYVEYLIMTRKKLHNKSVNLFEVIIFKDNKENF